MSETKNCAAELPQTIAIDYMIIRGSIYRFAKESHRWK